MALSPNKHKDFTWESELTFETANIFPFFIFDDIIKLLEKTNSGRGNGWDC